MDLGMLWFDDDQKATLEAKVQRAVDYYRSKYGQQPNQCYVHPGLLSPDGAPKTVGMVRLLPSKTVIKHHFWLGIGDG